MTEPYPWVPTVRRHKEHFWKDVSNQRNFLDETARALGIKEVFCYVQVAACNKSQLSDWYRIPRKEVIKLGGASLFKEHTSLAAALRACYPEYGWYTSRFAASKGGRQPHGFWNRYENQKEFVELIEKELNIKQVTNRNNLPSPLM